MIVSSCHPNRLSKGRGLCGNCYDKWLKINNPEYRKRQISNASNWAKLHPERRKELNIERRNRELADPFRQQKKRNTMLRNKYKITQDIYNVMLNQQNGGCAICERKPGIRPLHVDHSHTSGKVRGLLCHQCNWYLGTIERNPMVLEKIERYLVQPIEQGTI